MDKPNYTTETKRNLNLTDEERHAIEVCYNRYSMKKTNINQESQL